MASNHASLFSFGKEDEQDTEQNVEPEVHSFKYAKHVHKDQLHENTKITRARASRHVSMSIYLIVSTRTFDYDRSGQGSANNGPFWY